MDVYKSETASEIRKAVLGQSVQLVDRQGTATLDLLDANALARRKTVSQFAVLVQAKVAVQFDRIEDVLFPLLQEGRANFDDTSALWMRELEGMLKRLLEGKSRSFEQATRWRITTQAGRCPSR